MLVVRLMIMIVVLTFTFVLATAQKIMLRFQNWHPDLA
jgi:hypothetical protein